MAQDNYEPSANATPVIRSFDVGINGIEHDGIVTPEGSIPEEEEELPVNESLTPTDENVIQKSFTEINALFRIGWIAIGLIIILIIDAVLIASAHEYFKTWGAKYLFSLIALIDFVLIILFTLFGVFPFWILLLLIIAGVITAVWFISHKLESGG